MIFFKIGHTQSTPKLCLACLLSFDEQPGWAGLGRGLGVSNVEKNYIFGILMKNCTKYLSAIKICDVAGTPSEHVCVTKAIQKHFNGEIPVF